MSVCKTAAWKDTHRKGLHLWLYVDSEKGVPETWKQRGRSVKPKPDGRQRW